MLAEKFRIERVIGRGGMGIVIAAHHVQLDQLVAIKLPYAGSVHDHRALSRFLAEARTAARIRSENIARVFDVDTLDTGMPFLVMEYLEGCDLNSWLVQRGPLPVSLAVRFVLQVCKLLVQAHALGIVHRDLKPANLFCCPLAGGDWLIKVLDFGISMDLRWSTVSTWSSAMQSEGLLGSPHYMSPEQIAAPDKVDLRADIWSLGVLLFELITGKLPFEGKGLPELSSNIATQAMPRLTDSNPEVPRALQAVIGRCLRKNRERRFPNVTELAAALRPFATAEPRNAVCKTRSSGHPHHEIAAQRRFEAAAPRSWSKRALQSFRHVSRRTGHSGGHWIRVALIAFVSALGTLGVLGLI